MKIFKISLLSLLSILVLGMLSPTIYGQVYEWTDEKGVKHFSQFPHKNVVAKKVDTVKTPVEATEKFEQLKEKQKKDTEEYYENKKNINKTKEELEKEKLQKEKLQKYCDVARKNISTLNDQANRKFRDSDGNVTYYTDEVRNEKIKESQDFIDKHCKGL